MVMITTIITDFDGTLVDSFYANLLAYQQAFFEIGLKLSEEQYRKCFGLRFERFMSELGVTDISVAQRIKETKKECYPQYFKYIKPNRALIELVSSFKKLGGKTAIASTARRENLMNVVQYFKIGDCFDLVLAGMDVKDGKPSPEIYVKAIEALNSKPEETLIFEDSEVGALAAKSSGAHYLLVPQDGLLWQ